MKRRYKKMSLPLILIVFLILAARNGLFQTEVQTGELTEYDSSQLRVHFIDVGQADSTLIQMPNGQNMLIDAGNNDDGYDVVDYIRAQGIQRLDIVIGTHPHEDHIGGLDDVIKALDIGSIYMPKVQSNTKTFRDVLSAVKEKGLTVKTAKAGVELVNSDNFMAIMVAPNREKYEELNDYSAVIRMVYGDTAFLFTGDAERESEQEITEEVKADVLKVGHHGSSSSTSAEFFRRVNPDSVFIPCSKDNSYGHPHRETIQLLEQAGVAIFRADEDGTVIFDSDGKNVKAVK